MDEESPDEIRKQQRVTKREAREEGIGSPVEGAEPPARSYTDDTGVTDLGVDEPVVPEPLKGDRPDQG